MGWGLTLALAGAILTHWHAGMNSQPTGGWRRVDISTLREQFQTGRVAKQEALWYRVVK